jgi:hypothetical protein
MLGKRRIDRHPSRLRGSTSPFQGEAILRAFRMKAHLLIAAVCALAAASMPEQAFAWGATGHRMIGELAIGALPLEVPQFVRNPEAGRQIGEVAREPDRSKGAGQPHDADADPGHRINVGDDLKIGRNGPLLSTLPPTREAYDTALRTAGTNQYRAGYLPYSIIDGWQQLVMDFGYWRADVAAAKYIKTAPEHVWLLKDQYMHEGLIVRDLGFLAHFVGDGSQPMHVSVHGDGWGNFPNPQNFAVRGLHAKFEGSFVRDAIMRKDISTGLPGYRDCHCSIQQRVADYLGATHKEILTLFEIEKADGFEMISEGNKAFVAKRLAAATAELRDLIVDAWRRSAEISVGYPAIPVRDIESGQKDPMGSLQGLD